jgi:hypothetical protein
VEDRSVQKAIARRGKTKNQLAILDWIANRLACPRPVGRHSNGSCSAMVKLCYVIFGTVAPALMGA